jgi:hypothetical protein
MCIHQHNTERDILDVMEYNIPVGRADGEGDREGEGAASKERGEGERGGKKKSLKEGKKEGR